MPETINQNYITEKNKAANSPIMLYEITIPSPASVLYLAEWDTQIIYPTSGGHTYLPFPLTHEGVGMNILGEIDVVKVRLSSVDRSIVQSIETNNGLLGSKVVMKLVFLDKLSDADANISATFYIDSVEVDENNAVFTLTSKLDLYQVYLPGRLFERNHCQWIFKQEGCWLLSGSTWVAPGGFLHADVECDHTRSGPEGCKYHANSSRFGGFPAIPQRGFLIV